MSIVNKPWDMSMLHQFKKFEIPSLSKIVVNSTLFKIPSKFHQNSTSKKFY